ncbi:DUF805 domain-containing protein [Mesorhizobium xinjiangense]|uniref:DUF805 domain-containing protein n=1 Tax=Mesorhizobium xinjiangense TaxID=2678685 RepID=UPI001F227998|nr:DUF805 domain-containing protein [Mesorhizobium xinjiangense]
MNLQHYTWLFFRLSGRISRAAYLLGGLLANLVPAFLLYRFTLAPEASQEGGMWAFAFITIGVICVYSIFALSVKRLHDFDKPGALALSLFVPFLSYIAFVALCLIPGDKAPNRYGEHTNEPA